MRKIFLWLLVFAATLTLSPLTAPVWAADPFDISGSKLTAHADGSLTLTIKGAAPIPMNEGGSIQCMPFGDYWDVGRFNFNSSPAQLEYQEGSISQMYFTFSSAYTIPSDGLDIKLTNVKVNPGATPEDIPTKLTLSLSNGLQYASTDIPVINEGVPEPIDYSSSRLTTHADGSLTLTIRGTSGIQMNAGGSIKCFMDWSCWDINSATISTTAPLEVILDEDDVYHLTIGFTSAYTIPSRGLDIRINDVKLLPGAIMPDRTWLYLDDVKNANVYTQAEIPIVPFDIFRSKVTVHDDDSLTLTIRSGSDLPMKEGDSITLSTFDKYWSFADVECDTEAPLTAFGSLELLCIFESDYTIPSGGLDIKISNLNTWNPETPVPMPTEANLMLYNLAVGVDFWETIPVVREMKLPGETTIEVQGDVEVDQDGKITLLDAGALVVTGDGSLIELPSGSTIKSKEAVTASASAFAFRVLAAEGYITTIVVGPDGGWITYSANGATEHLSGGAIVTIGPDGVPAVTDNETSVTLKVLFQGRPSEPSDANVEKLAVKWIKGGTAIGQGETVTTENDGTAPISLPPAD